MIVAFRLDAGAVRRLRLADNEPRRWDSAPRATPHLSGQVEPSPLRLPVGIT